MSKKISNRWFIVLFAILIQLALGAIYSYGIIKPALQVAFSADPTMALMPFAIGLLTFAVVMVFAGRWQDKAGPRIVALTGGIVLAVGYILSGVITPYITDVWGIVITYGVVGGAGIGFGYVCPIACASKWFPDKKGLINGLAVAGFGAGAFIFNYVFDALLTDTPSTATISLNFIVSGIIMGAMVAGGALFLKNPPEGYKPEGWEPPVASDGGSAQEDWEPGKVIKTPTYWLLWIMFIFSAICGLMVIGNYKSYGNSIDPTTTATIAATVGGFAALFNGAGRIFWGKLSDNVGRTNAMKIMFLIQGISMFLFALIPNIVVWVILIQVIYFCFGGNFSLFPSATGDYFGTKNLGINYGLVFTAYGIAGIVGAVAATPMLAAMGGNYIGYFILFGVLSLVAMGLAFITKHPSRK
ncbi:MAG: L-lactate MFS transporter [Promethearchaeota archaeon]